MKVRELIAKLLLEVNLEAEVDFTVNDDGTVYEIADMDSDGRSITIDLCEAE